MRPLLWLICITFAWLAPSPVAACGATPTSFTLLTDDMGRVPAGTKVLKLYVYGTSIEPTPPTVTLSADRLGASLPMVVPVTLRVSAPWLVEVDLGSGAIQAGVSYALSVTGAGFEGSSGPTQELLFMGVEANRLPSELGTLALDKRASGSITLGGCPGAQEGEQVLIKLVASAAAEPWLRGVKHQLYVDGKPAFQSEIPLIDYVARKSETVIRARAPCSRSNVAGDVPFASAIDLELSAAEHKVHWTSTFPDGSSLETPSIDVDLRCAGTASPQTPPCCKPLVAVDAGAGVPIPADAGVNVATPVDSGPALARADAGPAHTADAGTAELEEGCSLGAGQRAPAQTLGLLVALFLLRTRAARRRHEARAPAGR